MSKVAGQVRHVTVDIYRASAPVKEKVRSSIRKVSLPKEVGQVARCCIA